MKAVLRRQLNNIKQRIDALDEPKVKQYLFARTRAEYEEILQARPKNAMVLRWRFPDEASPNAE